MRRFKAPSPAMVVALLALFVALGGTGYAARGAILSSPSKVQIIKIVKGVAPTLSVKSAASATPLPSGKSESGLFAGAEGASGVWLGLTVVYPRPLKTPIADANIIDVRAPASTAPHCPGPGKADRGYLCLYDTDYSNAGGSGEFQSDDGSYFPKSYGKFGVELYWVTSGPDAYVGGSWTVTAP